MITEGLKNADIAKSLGVAHETVRWHIRSLYSKIGAEDRFSAVIYGKWFLTAEQPSRGETEVRHLGKVEGKPPSRADRGSLIRQEMRAY